MPQAFSNIYKRAAASIRACSSAVAVSRGWLDASWLVTFALCLALSFLVSSPLNRRVFELYSRWRSKLVRFETAQRVPEEEAVDAGQATILIFGMGRVGAGAYGQGFRCTSTVLSHEIGFRRLSAYPEAPLCIACQSGLS